MPAAGQPPSDGLVPSAFDCACMRIASDIVVELRAGWCSGMKKSVCMSGICIAGVDWVVGCIGARHIVAPAAGQACAAGPVPSAFDCACRRIASDIVVELRAGWCSGVMKSVCMSGICIAGVDWVGGCIAVRPVVAPAAGQACAAGPSASAFDHACLPIISDIVVELRAGWCSRMKKSVFMFGVSMAAGLRMGGAVARRGAMDEPWGARPIAMREAFGMGSPCGLCGELCTGGREGRPAAGDVVVLVDERAQEGTSDFNPLLIMALCRSAGVGRIGVDPERRRWAGPMAWRRQEWPRVGLQERPRPGTQAAARYAGRSAACRRSSRSHSAVSTGRENQ